MFVLFRAHKPISDYFSGKNQILIPHIDSNYTYVPPWTICISIKTLDNSNSNYSSITIKKQSKILISTTRSWISSHSQKWQKIDTFKNGRRFTSAIAMAVKR